MSILNVQEVNSLFTTKLKLELSWSDNRLKFLNLKDDENLNILTDKHKLDIWIPKLVFTNTKNNVKAFFNDDSSYGYIKRGNKHLSISNH